MNEREKYERIWEEPLYRSGVGGVNYLTEFLDRVDVENSVVVDFGCGEGKTFAPLKDAGAQVILIDIADNCLPDNNFEKAFLRHDLSEPLSLSADYGYCVDMMEHLPTHQVGDVIDNIFTVVNKCYFMISLVPDKCGELIGETLHLTVEPADWWQGAFTSRGKTVDLVSQSTGQIRIFVTDDKP